VFRSGVIVSDTDFRIFRTYSGPETSASKSGVAEMIETDGGKWMHKDGTRSGWKERKIVGIDMATYRNNYIYHTSTDTPHHISPGALLHWGHNLVKLVEAAVHGIYTVDDLDGGKWRDGSEVGGVWRDVLGWFVVSYGPWTAVLLHVGIAIAGFLTWFKYSGPTDAERALGFENTAPHRLVHAVCGALSIPASFGAVVLMVKSPWYTMFATRGQSMSWFASSVRAVIIYAPMALFGGLFVSVMIPLLILVRGSPRSTRMGGYQTAVGFERRVAASFLVPFSAMSILLTLSGFGAAHLPTSLVVAGIVGLRMASSSSLRVTTPTTPTAPPLFSVSSGFSYVVPMLILMLGVGRASLTATETFVPMMARSSAHWKGMPLGGTWDSISSISPSALVNFWFVDVFIGTVVGFLTWTAWMGWILAILVARLSMSRVLTQRDVGDTVSIKAVISKAWIALYLVACVAPLASWFMGVGFQGDEHGLVVQRKRVYIQYAKEQGHDAWMNQIRVAHADSAWHQYNKVVQSVGTLWERSVDVHVANQIQYQWTENAHEKLAEWDVAWPRSPMMASIAIALDDSHRGKFKDLSPLVAPDMIKLNVRGNVGWDDGGKRMRQVHLEIDHLGVDYLSIVVSNVDRLLRYGLRVEPGLQTEEGFHWHAAPEAYEQHNVRRFHIRHTGSVGILELMLEMEAGEGATIEISGVDGRTWGIPTEDDVYGVYGNTTDVGDAEWKQSRLLMERVKAALPSWTDPVLLVTISGSWTV